MSDKIQTLVDRMNKVYGENHKLVKQFKKLASSYEPNDWNVKALEILVEAHEQQPIRD